MADRCIKTLGERLVGLYLQGSGAQDDDRAGMSDLDVVLVVADHLPGSLKDELAAKLDHGNLPVPAVGLDLVAVTRDSVRTPGPSPSHELWFSTGEAWTTQVEKEGQTSEHLVAFALCRERGRVILGPAPKDLFARFPERWLLLALIEILKWHRTKIFDALHDPLGQYSVLNACRAWHYAVERTLSSKSEGAEWVLSRDPGNALARGALAIRNRERTEPLDRVAIEAFLAMVVQTCRQEAA